MNNTVVIYDSNDGSRELEVGVITYGDNGELIIRVHEKENING